MECSWNENLVACSGTRNRVLILVLMECSWNGKYELKRTQFDRLNPCFNGM